jgi:hypothetical protein
MRLKKVEASPKNPRNRRLCILRLCPLTIPSQTIRIIGTLAFLCTGATIWAKNVHFIVVYRFLKVLRRLE